MHCTRAQYVLVPGRMKEHMLSFSVKLIYANSNCSAGGYWTCVSSSGVTNLYATESYFLSTDAR